MGDGITYTTITSDQTWGVNWVNWTGTAVVPPNAYRQFPEPKPERKNKHMRGLFEVFIVDPETAVLVSHEYVVASDERAAQLKGAMKAELGDVDDYDFIVRRLGDVRAKRKAKAS